MIYLDAETETIAIIIHKAGIPKLSHYQEALLTMLGKIEIKNCDPEFKEHLKTIYELLSHLQCDEQFRSQHSEG